MLPADRQTVSAWHWLFSYALLQTVCRERKGMKGEDGSGQEMERGKICLSGAETGKKGIDAEKLLLRLPQKNAAWGVDLQVSCILTKGGKDV